MNMLRGAQNRDQAAAPPDQDGEIEIGQVLATLWGGKWIIAAVTAIGIGIGTFEVARTPPTYEADALVQLEDRGGRLALPSEMRDLVESSASARTEIEIMRSRMVLARAVADLNLDWQITPERPPVLGPLLEEHRFPALLETWLEAGILGDLLTPYSRPGDGITLGEFQVPPHWLGAPIRLEVTEAGYVLELPDGRSLDGTAGALLTDADLRDFGLIVETITAPPGRVYTLRQVSERAATGRLRGGLAASEQGGDSGILRVTMTGPDPAQAERRLDAALQAYVQQNISRSAAEAERSLEFIRGQLPEAEAELRAAEERLSDFRDQAAEGALEREETLELGQELDFVSQSLLNRIARLENELRRLEERAETNRDTYPDGHPFFRQIDEARSEVEEQLSQLLGRVEDLPASQRRIVEFEREVETARQTYSELQTRAQEMEVLRASTVGSVRVVDTASASGGAIAPQGARIIAIAAAIGMTGGTGIVLMRNWLRRGLRDASDLERLDLPVFATVNHAPEIDHGWHRRGHLPVLALDNPEHLAIEGLRSLRTSLHFGMLDAPSKAIVLTSAAPQEGKTFTAVNLAVLAAETGQKVCLVDGDMRRGQLRRYFDLPRAQPGLAEVLSGELAIDDALVPMRVAGLHLLPTGRFPPNPSELLMRRELSELITTLDAVFDLIIIDSPPTLAVTDAVILSRVAGTALLVARHDRTVPGEVEAVKKTFQAAGLRLAGAVLNGFDPRKARGYGSYGYNYGYRYSYKSPGA